MNNSQEIVTLIKNLCKQKNIMVGDMLRECGLNKNALSAMKAGSMPLADNLGKIAQYLGVSTDYLLGIKEE